MPTQSRSAKPVAKKRAPVRRPVKSGNVKLLTSFRSLDEDAAVQTGFVRALKLSVAGVTLESPDPFVIGQKLALEFLLNNNRLANVTGKVTRVAKAGAFYRIEVGFDKLTAKIQHWINDQISG
jgi:hypothetical protein